MRNSDQLCMVVKLDEGIIFTGLTTPSALAKNFCDTNAYVRYA